MPPCASEAPVGVPTTWHGHSVMCKKGLRVGDAAGAVDNLDT